MGAIYDYDKILDWACKTVKSADISITNKDLIFQFRDECCSQALSKARVVKYLRTLLILAGWLGKDFPDADKADIKRVAGFN